MDETLHGTPNTPLPSADKPKLLIVDDDEGLCTQLKWAFAQDYEVFLAGDRRSAIEVFSRERPPIVTLDLGLPPRPNSVDEGFSTLSDILLQDSGAKVIVVTGQEEREHALKAIDQGAYDYFCKPIQLDELRIVLRRALHVYQLEREQRELRRRLSGEPFGEMLGWSPGMQKVFALIRKVATTDAPVLIVGESGTGKELAARAIHRESARRDGPFLVINCSAIPATLLESELFGHEKGAFTGAHIQRKGRIELAQGGTLFLDEIGEISLELQVKLLRFLQEHYIERVGGRVPIAIDARVIAATNIDLNQALTEGRFREDLYYRLNVITLALPPLRDRGEDIMLLAKILLDRFAAQAGKPIKGFTEDVQRAMGSYRWPGNVREMENRIKRAVIIADGARLTPTHLELVSPGSKDGRTGGLKEARVTLERELIQRSLNQHRGNVTRTATELGISRPTLYELMQKLGIRHERSPD
jgi:two-component system, NtrC family, response regulator